MDDWKTSSETSLFLHFRESKTNCFLLFVVCMLSYVNHVLTEAPYCESRPEIDKYVLILRSETKQMSTFPKMFNYSFKDKDGPKLCGIQKRLHARPLYVFNVVETSFRWMKKVYFPVSCSVGKKQKLKKHQS